MGRVAGGVAGPGGLWGACQGLRGWGCPGGSLLVLWLRVLLLQGCGGARALGFAGSRRGCRVLGCGWVEGANPEHSMSDSALL